MRNKIISIFLLFIIVVPTMLLFLWFKIEKRNAQIIFEETIQEENLIENLSVLKFSLIESYRRLTWENKKEFQYQNEMYDLVSSTIENDSIYIVCWLDKKETTVNKEFKKIVKHFRQENSQNNTEQKNLISSLKTWCYLQQFDIDLPIIFILKKHYFSLYIENYTKDFYSIFDPPPKV